MHIEIIDHKIISLTNPLEELFLSLLMTKCSSILAHCFDSFSLNIIFMLKFQITLVQLRHLCISSKRACIKADTENKC